MSVLLNQIAFFVTIILQLLVLRLLIKNRLQRRFFWFFVYIIYDLVEAALRLSVFGSKTWYFRIYYWTDIGEAAFLIMAIRESFLNVFRQFTRLRWFIMAVWGCVALALLIALFKALAFPPVAVTHQRSLIIDLELAVEYCVTAIGILFFSLALLFRIRGHQWDAGIISGFMIAASVAVFGLLTRSLFGTKPKILYAWLPAVAYILGEIEWLVVLGRAERTVPVPRRDLTVDDLTKVNQYIGVLGRLLGRKL
jgi:hypothetical protein